MEEIVRGCRNKVLRTNFEEETPLVPVIEEMLKEQLRFDIRLLDSKHLPIMVGETTTDKRR